MDPTTSQQTNQLHERTFVVWGLGKTGTAMAHYLATEGASVIAVDSRASASETTQAALNGLDIRYMWAGESPDIPTLQACDAIILSPGVPYDLPALVAARGAGVPTVAAMQWAARLLHIPKVAVTGTAGKSTTVSLIGAMLEASGLPTFVGGNLGTPLISIVGEAAAYQRLVLECSSFQLEATENLEVDVALLTNISDNHLDRHGTMAIYAACKGRLFASMSPDSVAITWGADEACESVLGDTKAQRLHVHHSAATDEVPLGASPTANGFNLSIPDADAVEHYNLNCFRLRGAHNKENVMMAALAARLAGANAAGIQQAIDSFAALPHRLEEINVPGSLRFYNDSKSTTPDSTAKAITAFSPEKEPLHLLLGGKSKGTPFAPLRNLITAQTKAVYLFGDAADEIGAALEGAGPITRHERMEDALAAASAAAAPGDCILLSPACASFDQFTNFEARGDAFRAWVHENSSPTPREPKGAC